MCELIVSVIDRHCEHPELDAKAPKRGMVIDVFEDGHEYGRDELNHPMFRILKFPGQPMSFGRALMGPELRTHRFALQRQYRIDIDHPAISDDLKAHLADDTRQEPSIIVDHTLIDTLKVKRPTIDDPHEIGHPANIIG